MRSIGARLPLQRLIGVFIGLVIFSMLALQFWHAWSERKLAFHEAEVTTSNLAKAMEQHASSTFDQAYTILDGIVERIAWDGFEHFDRNRLRQFMQRRVQAVPALHGLFLYGADGKGLVTSQGEATAPASLDGDRHFFARHERDADTRLRVGSVMRSAANGELVIPVSRRINHADGRFAGVLLATLRVDAFRALYERFDMDDGGVLILSRRDGTVLVQQPFDAAAIGTSIAQEDIFSSYLAEAPVGSHMAASTADGVMRLYSYRALERYPLVVQAALSKESILAAWFMSLKLFFIVGSLVVLGLLLIGGVLVWQIRNTVKAEAELRRAHDALNKLAMHDPLTGLANRRQFDRILPEELSRAVRTQRPLSLLMLDIDNFKRYNDLYGHVEGDVCLCAVADVVRASAERLSDLVVRYGGEEIAVLLPNTDAVGARQVAEWILDRLRQKALEHEGNGPGIVTVSIGMYTHQPVGSEPISSQMLIRAADDALYLAKRFGRNQAQPAHAAYAG